MTTPSDKALAQACPFCGFDKPDVRDNRTDAFWVDCPVCGAETTGFDTPAEAIAAWNRRTPPAQAAEAVERVAIAIAEHRTKSYADMARAAIAAMQANP